MFYFDFPMEKGDCYFVLIHVVFVLNSKLISIFLKKCLEKVPIVIIRRRKII